ncbi:MAG: TA system VapC family ribonuclease toxin [Candidatus Acidiferrum sp.]
MPRSTSLFLFLDVNVWLALSYERHVHHVIATRWFRTLENDAHLCFCRHTQLGLLRLLTTDAVMGPDHVLSQSQAWSAYDRCLSDGRTLFLDEPTTIERRFRFLSQETRSSPKDWADAYLAAFAEEAGLCLVTFDQALHKKSTDGLLLA